MRWLATMLVVMICSAAATGGAFAQTPTSNWSGWSAGVTGGFGWGHSNQTDSGVPCTYFGTCPSVPIPEDGSFSVDGGVVGGAIGYAWQFAPWVFGVQGDYSWADIEGSSGLCGAASATPHNCGAKLESLGTVRGTIGYAVGPTGAWLPYVTGGLAVGELKAWDTMFGTSGSDFRAGWTVGGGLAVIFAPHWTANVEYLYVDLDGGQVFDIVPGVPESVRFTANILRAGIKYQF